MQKINLQQAPKLPTEPSHMKPTDLLPFRSSSSCAWKWFRLAKNVEYSKNKTAHSEYQRAYCFKCLSDGIDPMQASVVYRDSTQVLQMHMMIILLMMLSLHGGHG